MDTYLNFLSFAGRCTEKSWRFLNKQLGILNKYKENTIGAISRYDAEYIKYYTGIQPLLVPSYSGFYMNSTYEPKKQNYLIFTVHDRDRAFIQGVKASLQTVGIQSDFVYDLYKFYSTKDLVQHPAVISLPYSVMSFRTTELYSLGIPLFVPSPKFYLNMGGMGHDRTSTTEPYCDKDPNLEAKMRPNIDLRFSAHPYSPNTEIGQDPEAELYWMQYADFYDWPHIQHFDSYEHLKELLVYADLKSIHESMMQEIALRRLQNTKSWCDISMRILNAK